LFDLSSVATDEKHRKWFTFLNQVVHEQLPPHGEVMMGMDVPLGFDDPASVFGYEVRSVFDWQHDLVGFVDEPLGFRGHLPVGLRIPELGHDFILMFLIGKI